MRRLACAFALLAVVGAAATAEAGGAPPPPPPKPCVTDNDCDGCQRCNNGYCPGAEVEQASCMCNAECELVGKHSCDLSLQKPLCGGTCNAAAPTRDLVCGAGFDHATLEPFTAGAIGDVATAATALPDGAIIVEPFGGP
jgi:hypothetical protein